MNFYCKKCQKEFEEEYSSLFDHVKCPHCKHKDLVLVSIKQGVHPPEDGFGLSYWEFEDVLEKGKESYVKEFFSDELNLIFTRKGEEFSLTDSKNNPVDLEDIHIKIQKDGKLQRMIYNIYYVLLTGA